MSAVAVSRPHISPGTNRADRWVSRAAAATVAGLAGIAGAISYRRTLAAAHGDTGWHAHLSGGSALRLAGSFDLVLNGHVHQSRQHEFEGVTHLWAPTTWAVLPEAAQRSVGVKRCGILPAELGGDVRADLIAPDGLDQLTVTEDFPDPYH